jgi:hypothetical protein
MDAMNDKTVNTRAYRRAWLLTCAVGAALLMTACGSSSGSSGGNASTPSSGGSSTVSAQTTKYQKVLAFSECMRSHGVPDFPDPNANGAISLGSIASTLNGTAVRSAEQACRHLLPNGGIPTPAQLQKALNLLLKFSECMRSHGVPNYPDPSLVDGTIKVDLQGTGITATTPHILTAAQACEPLLTNRAAAQ